jgi:hypothetical protein
MWDEVAVVGNRRAEADDTKYELAELKVAKIGA